MMLVIPHINDEIETEKTNKKNEGGNLTLAKIFYVSALLSFLIT